MTILVLSIKNIRFLCTAPYVIVIQVLIDTVGLLPYPLWQESIAIIPSPFKCTASFQGMTPTSNLIVLELRIQKVFSSFRTNKFKNGIHFHEESYFHLTLAVV